MITFAEQFKKSHTILSSHTDLRMAEKAKFQKWNQLRTLGTEESIQLFYESTVLANVTRALFGQYCEATEATYKAVYAELETL